MTDTPENSLLGKIAAYTEILATDPRSTIFASLSEAYRKMGMLAEARKVAEVGLELLPDYCPGHVVLARIHCQLGNLEASVEAFSRALEMDPDNLAALVGFSRVLLLREAYRDAKALLLRARQLSPADPVINKLLLGLPAEEQSVDPAYENPDGGTAIAPAPEERDASEPVETVTLAELYLKQGLADKALGIYRNLLARDPDNLELRRRIRDLEASTFTEVDATGKAAQSPAPEDSRSDIALSDTASHTHELSDLPIVEQLNRLLISIRKRRGDV